MAKTGILKIPYGDSRAFPSIIVDFFKKYLTEVYSKYCAQNNKLFVKHG